MTKHSNGRSGLKPAAFGSCNFGLEPFSRTPRKSFAEVRDDMRLKRAIQRAVRCDSAPSHLVDSIRKMIRE